LQPSIAMNFIIKY